jgi:hypothetical protein
MPLPLARSLPPVLGSLGLVGIGFLYFQSHLATEAPAYPRYPGEQRADQRCHGVAGDILFEEEYMEQLPLGW